MGEKGKHTPYYELLEALESGCCALCYLGQQAARRYLQSLLYEGVTDVGVRQHVRAAKGFCRRHAWQARAEGGALGIAIMYRDVVADVLAALESACYEAVPVRRRLREWADRSLPTAATRGVVQALEGKEQCPVCAAQQRAEAMYCELLLEHIGDEAIARALQRGRGLCLSHLRQVLARVRTEEAFEAIVLAARSSFRRLLGELEEMIRRHDHRFIQELGPYGDAWLKALAQVSGERAGSESSLG
jgi:hypothetical protein